MPQGEPLKDYYGRVFGYLHVQPNGDVWAYDYFGRLVGKYVVQENLTKDFFGKIIAQGNVVASLIPPIDQQ